MVDVTSHTIHIDLHTFHPVQLCTACSFGHILPNMSESVAHPQASAASQPARASSHRQAKRERTRRALEHSATRLVLEHGFHNVTVEDMCAPVGIARRTFFNYFGTKEEAVLGSQWRALTDEEIRTFATTSHPDLPLATLRLLSSTLLDPNEDDTFDKVLAHRRRAICDQEPHLLQLQLGRLQVAFDGVTKALLCHYERFPNARRSQEPPRREAMLLTCIVSRVLFIAMHQECDEPDEAREGAQNGSSEGSNHTCKATPVRSHHQAKMHYEPQGDRIKQHELTLTPREIRDASEQLLEVATALLANPKA